MDTKDKNTMKKKKKRQNPEAKFRFDLDNCSKKNDFNSAISLYESAKSQNFHLNSYHFNTLLYLCSNALSNPCLKTLAVSSGVRIFDDMKNYKIAPNEATITAIARLTAAKGEGDYAFELVKGMGEMGLVPRLRTYDPALLFYCENGEADKGYEVEEHMVSVGMSLEEQQLAALLKVSTDTKRGDKVYEYLHKLRSDVRCVSLDTAKVIEDWFRSDGGIEGVEFDVGRVEEAVLRNGGGWHGMGWMGKGKWVVRRGIVNLDSGKCGCCRERLACVDIGRAETEGFAQSVASLAVERETKANFKDFMEWLEKHADYEAIVDGANVGLYQQNFADGGFSTSQLGAVVKELYNRNQRWPLVILHNKRLRALQENPSSRKLLEEWLAQDVLYATPHGSNDDWYWLYSAVKLKCLLVTNDEMRDHIFELLGRSFILRWKERHQVHYTFVKGNLKLHMPPPYSSVIQESDKGTWHVPIAVEGSNDESSRTWLCITPSNAHGQVDEPMLNAENDKVRQTLECDGELIQSYNSELVACNTSLNFNPDLSQVSDNKTAPITGKRKERSTSPNPQPCLD